MLFRSITIHQSSYIAKVGLPMGLMYGYVYEGTYKYDDFNKSGNSYSLKPGVPHYSTETNTQPGMPKYADLNGRGGGRDGMVQGTYRADKSAVEGAFRETFSK